MTSSADEMLVKLKLKSTLSAVAGPACFLAFESHTTTLVDIVSADDNAGSGRSGATGFGEGGGGAATTFVTAGREGTVSAGRGWRQPENSSNATPSVSAVRIPRSINRF